VSQNITLNIDNEQREVTQGTTGAEVFADDKKIVVMRVDGALQDLSRVLVDGTTVEGVSIESQDGLNVLRHSTGHVLAQAVQQLRPDAKLGIGPYITDGFYFDFDVEEPFTPEDLKKLEKMMLKIVNQN
jgi:threonyl-tRNA synthetase